MENKIPTWMLIVLGILILSAAKKYERPYHSSVYSSYEEEQMDEMNADINYLLDKLERIKNY